MICRNQKAVFTDMSHPFTGYDPRSFLGESKPKKILRSEKVVQIRDGASNGVGIWERDSMNNGKNNGLNKRQLFMKGQGL